ncbi:MAG: hypothetical protein RBS39_06760 [Phycisphaerales bacterium]|jgi:hypothetical protein|nr:hypothetical protein [Phycisphaerales bacterium]
MDPNRGMPCASPAGDASVHAPPDAVRVSGVCHAIYAFDLGQGVDLVRAEAFLAATTGARSERLKLESRRPAPSWFGYEPAPLRVPLAIEPRTIAPGFTTGAHAEAVLYDFAGVSISVPIVIDHALTDLPALTAALPEDRGLESAARAAAASLLERIAPAIDTPVLADMVEDYAVLALTQWSAASPPITPGAIAAAHAPVLARILQGERGTLSREQVDRTLAGATSYAENDLALLGWNAAVLLDAQANEVVPLLAHANVELLEMRVLDARLDLLLERAHDMLARVGARRLWPVGRGARELREFAEVQTDAALLFESVENAIRIVGDPYLARVYETAAARMHIPRWDAGVLRKLATAESIYQKMEDAASSRRAEMLEVIIILLIALEIVMALGERVL